MQTRVINLTQDSAQGLGPVDSMAMKHALIGIGFASFILAVSPSLRADGPSPEVKACETACMEKHDVEMGICGRKQKACVKSCPSSGLRGFCVSRCNKTQKSCSKEAFAAEKACINECVGTLP